jgi:hypothetical protein
MKSGLNNSGYALNRPLGWTERMFWELFRENFKTEELSAWPCAYQTRVVWLIGLQVKPKKRCIKMSFEQTENYI